MLWNSMCRLLPYQKCLLYKTCIFSIVLYKFLLWHYNKVPLLYLLNKLNKLQWWAALWILGIFCTLPTIGIKAIAGLILIYFHLWKLSSCDQLQIFTLLYYIIMLSDHFLKEGMLHSLNHIIYFWRIWLLNNKKN